METRAGGEGGVDVLEGLFGCDGGGPASLADAVEDAAGLRLLLGFIAEEGILHGDLGIGRVEPSGSERDVDAPG